MATVPGTQTADTLSGTPSDDVLFGYRGRDLILGNQGNDRVYGGQDSDTLYGGQGQDTLSGDLGDDLLFGNLGDDLLLGNQGSDTLFGGQGNDTLYGGQGDDLLYGDLGDNVLSGDLGIDTAVFTGARAEYDATQNEDGSFTLVGPTGTTRATTIEFFQFSDGTVAAADLVGRPPTVPVNNRPVAVADTLAAVEDTAVTYTAAQLLGNDRDPDGDTLRIAAVTNGAGGTAVLNPNGTVTFTPSANFNGAAGFSYTASDGRGGISDPASVTVNVASVNDAPAGADATITLDEDTARTFTAADFGFTDPVDAASASGANALQAVVITTVPTAGTLSFNGNPVTAGTSIAGGQLSQLSYQPAANANGTGYASLTFQVVDDGGSANGGQDTDPSPNTLTFDVTPVNDPPVAVADTLPATEDTAVTFTAAQLLGNDTDIDSPNSALRIASVTSGTGGSVVLNPDGTVTFTPVANFNGAASFSYVTSDGTAVSNSATVTVNVAAVNDAPTATITATSYSATEQTDLSLKGQLSVGDVDGGNGPETVTLAVTAGILTVTSGTSGATVVSGSGTDSVTISGTIAQLNALLGGDATSTVTYNADSDTPPGSATLTLTINDNGNTGGAALTGSDVATVSIAAVNDNPVARPDFIIIDEDAGPITGDVLDNDSDVDGGLLAVDGLQINSVNVALNTPVRGQFGTFQLNQDGSYTYTADPNRNGVETFTYSVSDGRGGGDTSALTITVTPVNDAPIANPDNFSTNTNQSLSITPAGLLANDTDVDGDTLSVTSITQPQNGTVTINQDGNLLYTPNTGYSGTDRFTYRAYDGGLNSNPTQISIAVSGLPTAASVTGGTLLEANLNTAQGGLVTGTQPTSVPDATTGNLSYNFGGDGANGTTPFAWSTSVTARDPEVGDPALSALTSGGDPVQWSVQSGSNGQTLIGTAAGNGPYNGTAVARLELTDPNTGAYRFTLLGPIDHPDVNQSGNADPIALDFAYTVRDGSGDTVQGGLSLTVTDDAPVARNTTVSGSSAATSNTNLELVIDVSGSQADASGLTNLTRLQVVQAALNELIERYNQLGTVAVRIVTFSTSATANGGGWLTADQAQTFIANLVAGGSTNYDAALATAQTAFDTPGRIVGADNVLYFLSDGQPNPASLGIDATEQAIYENFLNNNDIKSYALGVGRDVSATNLNPIAYDGTTSTQIPAILVTDLSQLDATLTQTIASPITGTAINSGGTSFSIPGADQPAGIASVLLDGTTFTLVDTDATTHILTRTDGLGSVFTIDFDNGNYTYQPRSNLTQPVSQTIGVTVADADEDRSTANLTFNITSADYPPIARNDTILTNSIGSGATILIPDAALLYNDTIAENGTIVTGPTNIQSATAVTRSNDQFAFIDDNLNGGSFRYGVTNPSSLNDDGVVTINRAQAGATTLVGTGLGDVLVADPTRATTINANAGNDYLLGGNQSDTLNGGEGNDRLNGGAGNDVVRGGVGNDALTGGTARDTFLFAAVDLTPLSPATDTITDFTIGAGANSDTLALSQLLTGLSPNATAADLNNYLRFTVSGSSTILNIDQNGTAGGANINQIISFQNTNLYTQFGVSPASQSANTDLIQQLLSSQNLSIN
ncbi:hypothetical protein MPOCJGCO_1122 [Methylobacterium trifolii]|uniref:VWFA domain-containing protein n=2 Tax=Methylobacterium trifolii TaxID=1003092 RepID=A0ABQ4TVE2_9HYPH|nr:hypothetical protein MPOCJGCO_1122 [Methylobacterium trifolii]